MVAGTPECGMWHENWSSLEFTVEACNNPPQMSVFRSLEILGRTVPKYVSSELSPTLPHPGPLLPSKHANGVSALRPNPRHSHIYLEVNPKKCSCTRKLTPRLQLDSNFVAKVNKTFA